jgi:hypothetical protein
MSSPRIDRKFLEGIFTRMDDALDADGASTKQTLCVFGASAVLLYGSDTRQTQDVDVWRNASDINDRALARMAKGAQLDLNPTELEVDKLYLQIVTDGVVQLPLFSKDRNLWAGGRPSETLWTGKNLTIIAPPPAVVAAAKMVRAEPQDIEDVVFIMAKKGLKIPDIKAAIATFPGEVRERASENLVCLQLVLPSDLSGKAKEKDVPER